MAKAGLRSRHADLYMNTETFALRPPQFAHRKQEAWALLPPDTMRHSQTSLRANTWAPTASPDPAGEVNFTPVIPSTIQGGEQEWWIQFIWAIYYAAGTLVFTSIMAVTVIELVVWVILSCVTMAASKVLAFRLCRNWK